MFRFEGGSDGKVAGCGWVRAWVGTIGGDVGLGWERNPRWPAAFEPFFGWDLAVENRGGEKNIVEAAKNRES